MNKNTNSKTPNSKGGQVSFIFSFQLAINQEDYVYQRISSNGH